MVPEVEGEAPEGVDFTFSGKSAALQLAEFIQVKKYLILGKKNIIRLIFKAHTYLPVYSTLYFKDSIDKT